MEWMGKGFFISGFEVSPKDVGEIMVADLVVSSIGVSVMEMERRTKHVQVLS